MSHSCAIDEDICPLRATPAIQEIVERVAIARRVPLVDFNSILKNDCLEFHGHPAPGNEYFLDHVHPTIESHRLLAIAIIEAMVQKGIVRPNRLWLDEAVDIVSPQIASRVDLESQSRALTNLAQVLSWAGKQQEAGPIAVEAVRIRSEHGLVDDPESMFYAGVHFAMTGADEQAMTLLTKVVEREPNNAQARWRLATLLYDQTKYEEAKTQIVEAVRLDPSDAYSQQILGALLLKSGEYEQALMVFHRAEELAPNDEGIRANIKFALEQLGRG